MNHCLACRLEADVYELFLRQKCDLPRLGLQRVKMRRSRSHHRPIYIMEIFTSGEWVFIFKCGSDEAVSDFCWRLQISSVKASRFTYYFPARAKVHPQSEIHQYVCLLSAQKEMHITHLDMKWPSMRNMLWPNWTSEVAKLHEHILSKFHTSDRQLAFWEHIKRAWSSRSGLHAL